MKSFAEINIDILNIEAMVKRLGMYVREGLLDST